MKKSILFTLAAMLLLTGTALAEGYSFSYPIAVTDTQGQVVENVSNLEVLAIAEDGSYLVFAQDRIVYMDTATLSEALEGSELPQVPDAKTNLDMSNTETVTALQQELIDANFLEGNADGMFGSQSLKALQTMEETYGIAKSNGQSDISQYVMTVLQAINGRSEGVTKLVGDMPAKEVVYAAIIDNAQFDLEPLYNVAFVFDFDEMEEEGSIVLREGCSWESEDTSEIDAVTVETNLGWTVENKDGYTISPVMYITTIGARSFMPRQIILKSGDTRVELSANSVSKSIENGKVAETVAFVIHDDLLAAWQNYASEDMKIRLTGKYRSVDFTIDVGAFSAVSEFLNAYTQLNG